MLYGLLSMVEIEDSEPGIQGFEFIQLKEILFRIFQKG